MSINSEITRLQTAKSDIASAISEKGVTVPESTKLDEMAALIEGIQTGNTTYRGDTLFYGELSSITLETHGSNTVILAATYLDPLIQNTNVLSIHYTKSNHGIAAAFLTDGSIATMNCTDDGTNLTIYKTGVVIEGAYAWFAF